MSDEKELQKIVLQVGKLWPVGQSLIAPKLDFPFGTYRISTAPLEREVLSEEKTLKHHLVSLSEKDF